MTVENRGSGSSDTPNPHAPEASRMGFEKNLCMGSDNGECLCEMYDGHEEDAARPYRNAHHCECGRGWS